MCVERCDAGNPRERQGSNADRGCHRLVQMEHVEALSLERAANPEDTARRENDVGKGAVRRNDHRPSDRNHARRGRSVTSEPGVQHAREAARRVVPHDRPCLDSPALEGLGLQLGVLDDRPPEGPGVRDDDAYLHCGTVTGA
jgi:hypothetical protein